METFRTPRGDWAPNKVPDLGAIKTLGFRGEALPSVASVCHLKLRTRGRGMDTGTFT